MRDYLELTKPRITLLILVCTAVGYFLGSGISFHWTILLHALLGTALLASGTAALNQWYEVDSDAKMRRTRMHPMPAGRMKRSHGFVFGVLLFAGGFAELWRGTNLLAPALGFFTLLSYLLLDTPLKLRSPICTTVGAIPGATTKSDREGQSAIDSTLGADGRRRKRKLWASPEPHSGAGGFRSAGACQSAANVVDLSYSEGGRPQRCPRNLPPRNVSRNMTAKSPPSASSFSPA